MSLPRTQSSLRPSTARSIVQLFGQAGASNDKFIYQTCGYDDGTASLLYDDRSDQVPVFQSIQGTICWKEKVPHICRTFLVAVRWDVGQKRYCPTGLSLFATVLGNPRPYSDFKFPDACLHVHSITLLCACFVKRCRVWHGRVS